MTPHRSRTAIRTVSAAVAGGALVACVVFAGRVGAQVPQGAPPPPAPVQTARASQPVDFSGYWASVVTEDWQWRFVTPIVGDYTGIPLNDAGDKLARAWDHEADLGNGEQCKAFGAAAINRLPTRLHIDWQDDNTMRLEWDLGTQSRVVHFGSTAPAPGARSYQGHAVGEWVSTQTGRGGRGRGGRGGRGGGRGGRDGGADGDGPPAPQARPGGLKIVTTNLREQYLRQNGPPVSENAVVTEYLDIVSAPDGREWLVVRTMIDDPTYLSQQYIVSSQFVKEADGSKWSPSACELLPRLKDTATQVPRAQGG